MPKSKKVFVNLQCQMDDNLNKQWYCGYKIGKKYFEQEERFKSEDEAKKALEN